MRNKNNKHIGIEIDPELHYKLHYISKYYGRSANGEILFLIRQEIKAFEKACGHAIPYVIAPRRPGDIATCYAKADKAEKELGWTAKLGIDEMCSSLWNWQSKNPDGYNTKK